MTTKAKPKTVWERLSKIDVSDHTEKKGNLTYLSWAWAWGTLMDHFPYAKYTFEKDEVHLDGSVTVHCTIQVGACQRTMWLPVMDHRNRAVVNPDSRAISDSKMRCLTKCLAMFGLGHYIYAGEDLPPGENDSSKKNISKPTAKPKAKAKAKRKSAMTEPTKENADAVYVSELQAQLKKLAHRLHDTGEWEPDDDTKAMIKSAMKSDDASLVKQTLDNLTLLAEAAGQLTSDKELF